MVPPVEIDAKCSKEQVSSGASSPASEATLSISAVKTGPAGRTILLPTADVAAYKALVDSVNRQFQPESYQEKSLAQAIVDSEWRLRRISNIQTVLVDEELIVKYAKQLKHLGQQERFLCKRLKADTAELNRSLKENPRAVRRGLFLVPKPWKG